MYNNAELVLNIGRSLESSPVAHRRSPRQPLRPNFCLPERLPSQAFIQREAALIAPKAILRQLRRNSPSPPLESPRPTHERRASMASTGSSSSTTSPENSHRSSFLQRRPSKPTGNWKDPQPFEVFRAVEKKDLMFLMEVRDRNFELLLRKTGDATPLTHAMRCGHKDVAVVLLGAFSRYINHLEDDDMRKPRTKVMLKALRTNLKIAIDFGLASAQSDLQASFLQTLIMSEGDKWLWGQVSTISLALRSGTAGKPVQAAEQAVLKFTTKELGKADLIAAVGAYIANATADLLLLGAWSCVLDSVQGATQMPSYFYARDDRLFQAFGERMDTFQVEIRRSCSRRLKWQLRVLRLVLEGRHTSYRSKVEVLASELDEGEGV